MTDGAAGTDTEGGSVEETYAAAIQHDLVSFPDATLVGVVRRPPGWFHALTDENVPALGPPESLLDETKTRYEDLKMAGMCDEGAHNAAWEEVGFEDRYRDHLDSPEARDALDALDARLRDGEDLVLVCFEGDSKRCHRHLLLTALRDRLSRDEEA
ncbi:DUF488 domain-containing protein [Halomarina litorea]|uniref:DUF488 domain-containing protein n=1 Tax=Halomarina litorea TaxID=2961595 RepID=UPI0020C41E48|nr:DUF488 domain-containing protein [Halomarina sp. BCD28]